MGKDREVRLIGESKEWKLVRGSKGKSLKGEVKGRRELMGEVRMKVTCQIKGR